VTEPIDDQLTSALGRGLPFLEPQDVVAMMRVTSTREAPDSSFITREGTRNNGLMVILDGHARVFRNKSGHMIPFARLHAGELIGEIGFLDRGAASATVIADGLVRLLHIEDNQARALVESVPGLERHHQDRS
jgi:CRP-like cAMP-binding protein